MDKDEKTSPGDGDDDQLYEGQYKDGKRHGKGRMAFKYGVYEGDWAHGRMNGFGVLHLKTGNVYEGNFVDNRFEGWGKLRWNSGKVYEGQLRAGQMCGRGKLTSEEGIYEGEFYDNQMSGKGTMKFSSGDVYTGEWRNGTMWGTGRLNRPDGAVFSGAFFKNMKHGRVMRYDGRGNEYSERYCRDELQVSVKVKSRSSKAGRAVSRFIERIGMGGREYEDVTSPTLEPSEDRGTSPPTLFDRPDVTKADVEDALDRRALRSQSSGNVGARDDDRRTGSRRSSAAKRPEAWGDGGVPRASSEGPTSPGTAAFDEFFVERTSIDRDRQSAAKPDEPPPLPPGPPPPTSHYVTQLQ